VRKPGLQDILPLALYEQVRNDYRRDIIEEKRRRRVHVGDRVTLLFENRRLVVYQVQEMCRAEKLATPGAIQAEIDTYAELLPGPGELSATLFVEIPDQRLARAELDRLSGLDERVSLVVGDRAPVRVTFEPGHMTPERVAAVQYVRFSLDEGTRTDFIEGSIPVSVRIDHPSLRAETQVPGRVRESLARDLRAEEGE